MLSKKTKNSKKTNIIATSAIIALLTTSSFAKGLYIVEAFSCEVALADYHHLTQSVKENNPQFVQEQLEASLKATIEALAKHSECEGVSDEN